MKKLLLAATMAALVVIAGTANAEGATATPYLVVEAQLVGQDFVGWVGRCLACKGCSRPCSIPLLSPRTSTRRFTVRRGSRRWRRRTPS